MPLRVGKSTKPQWMSYGVERLTGGVAQTICAKNGAQLPVRATCLDANGNLVASIAVH